MSLDFMVKMWKLLKLPFCRSVVNAIKLIYKLIFCNKLETIDENTVIEKKIMSKIRAQV